MAWRYTNEALHNRMNEINPAVGRVFLNLNSFNMEKKLNTGSIKFEITTERKPVQAYLVHWQPDIVAKIKGRKLWFVTVYENTVPVIEICTRLKPRIKSCIEIINVMRETKHQD